MQGITPVIARPYVSYSDIKFDDFRHIIESRQTSREDYPLASSLAQDVIPLYDAPALRASGHLTNDWTDPANLPLKEEFIQVLKNGPGVVIFRGAYTDTRMLDKSTEVLQQLLDEQKAIDTVKRDENYIVSNTNEKWAKRDPVSYSEYFKNDVLALASAAWLGPWYQMTSQISLCDPGNKAQKMHRDYHLGAWDRFPFKRGDKDIVPAAVALFPAHMHASAHYMTLQGAIAHIDMPLETGPTMFLPYSQLYEAGYLASTHPEFVSFFEKNYVQAPISKGDVVFFNPAIYHGAGRNDTGPSTNTPGINRIANLVQISSAFGRPSDNADRRAMTNYIYPHLLEQKEKFTSTGGKEGYSENDLFNVVSSTAESYLFPTNCRFVHGYFQPPQAEVVWKALMNDTPADELAKTLEEEEILNKTGGISY